MEVESLRPDRNHEEEMKADVFKFVSYQPTRDPPSDVRNALLVVAALIATITFDKGTDPPDGLNETTIFLIANTLAFSASLSIIEFCSGGFPFQRELRASILAAAFAYGAGAGQHVNGVTAYILLFLASFAPFLARTIPRCFQKWC